MALGVTAAYGNSSKEIAAKVLPNVVLISVQDTNGLPIAQGSGFFIASNEIVTNYHVLAGGAKASAKIVGQSTQIEIMIVVAADEARDLAILQVSTSNPTSLIQSNQETSVGEEIYVAGNPEGLEGTFSGGLVSGKRSVGDIQLLQITAPISPGSSGGPVVNTSGEVVGITVATLRFGQSLNFAIPVAQLTALARSKPRSLAEAFATTRKKTPTTSTADEEFQSSDGVLSAYALSASTNNFSFTIRNNHTVPLYQVGYVVIAYDNAGRPLDYRLAKVSEGAIPAGLAKRVSGSFDANLPFSAVARYEVRLLSYSFENPSYGLLDSSGRYVVMAGDSVSKIARKFALRVADLEKANPEMDAMRLKVGQKLIIPR